MLCLRICMYKLLVCNAYNQVSKWTLKLSNQIFSLGQMPTHRDIENFLSAPGYSLFTIPLYEWMGALAYTQKNVTI